MAANTVTYFGDVTTAGNTTVFQNLTSQGNYSIFSGNVIPEATGTGSIGTTGVLFTSNSNTTTLNVTSLYATTGSFIGLNTTGGGSSLNVAGNIWTSNALSGPNVFATTSANIASLNTAFITGPLGFVGIGTTASGASLNVYGNFWASNALSAPNVFAVTSANLASLNTSTIFGTAGLVGINTTASGATLNVTGNAYVSNAIGAQNVFATSFANVTNLITSTIVSTTGFVGINTTGGGARLNVAGNVWASNALAANNVFATVNANVLAGGVLNTGAIFGTTGFVGINTTGGGATLNVAGNVYVSNGLGAANVLPTMNANIVTTNVTYMNLVTAGLGINGPAQAGSNVQPTGFVSSGTLTGSATVIGAAPTSNTALSLPNSSSWLALGVGSAFDIPTTTFDVFVEAWIYLLPGFTGTAQVASVGEATVQGTGWSLEVTTTGAVFKQSVSNKTFNQATSTTAISTGTWVHVAGVAVDSGGGTVCYVWVSGATRGADSSGRSATYSASDRAYIGALNGVGGGNGYYIRDVRLTYGLTAAVPTSFTPEAAPFTNTVPTYAFGSGGTVAFRLYSIYLTYVQPLVKVAGNVWCSNAFQTSNALFTNVLAVTSNLGPTATKQIFSPAVGGIVGVGQVPVVGAATLQVTDNIFASNALQSANINASTSANVTSANVLTITNSTLRIGVGKDAPTANLDVVGNVFASNALQSPIINVSTSANMTSSNIRTITNATLRIGVGKGAPTANLDVLGNVFASNALQSSNILATSANSIFSNITSNNIGSSFGINKASPSSNLDVSGNVLVTGDVTATGIDQQLPVAPFDGTGTAGAYTNVANGVTFTVGATSETATHEAWRAFNAPAATGSSLALGKFQLYERDSMTVGNQLWSPNGRYYFTVNSTSQTISDYYLSTTVATVATSTITSLYLTTAGFLQGVNSSGAVVYTSANITTGYGPYRFAMENQGFAAIYDRYNTILYQISTTQSGWETSGTYGGNSVTSVGGYRIHTFTTVGSQRFVVPSYLASVSADYLIVAGGGGGGFDGAGGGGGGGIVIVAGAVLNSGVYTVTIGAGGAGATGYAANGSQGGNSSFVNTVGGSVISQTAIGGGGGYDGHARDTVITTGGSGGGGGFSTFANEAIASGPGLGTPTQGNNGGAGYNDGLGTANAGGGGGGTAGFGGTAGNGVGGTGAAGYTTPISGVSTTYAGGGGGGTWSGAGNASGGAGGGGSGGATNGGVVSGANATFYGGGGGGGGWGTGTGGAGFQGIFIIRYLISSVAVSNAWGFSSAPQTLTFRMPTMYIPTSLLIQGIDYNNSPNSANAFTFSGSTDGTTYKTLTSGSTFLSNTDYGYNIYSITTNTAWNYFQLRVTGADALPGYVNQMILNGQISWSPTANAVTTNVTTTNVLTIAGNVGINTSTGGGATIQILGNVYASNALFGVIRSPLANTTTLNTSILYGTSGPVGFNTTPVAGGPTLQFGYGNLYASNAISGQNVAVTTIQTYNEDLTRRSPYLVPSSGNVTAIQNWIAASCNTTQKVGWSVAPVPTFNNATVGVTGSALYSSSLLAPDGRVYFTPASATNIGVFNPKTNEFSTIVPVGGSSLTGTYKYGSSILCPNGNIFFISNANTTSLIFNPVDKTARDAASAVTTGQCKGGILGGTGEVICPGSSNSLLRRFNPITGALIGTLNLTLGYISAVLTPTGNIVCVPFTSTTIRVVNSTATVSFLNTTHSQTTPAYAGGVLVPDGNVVCVPFSSLNITLYNPTLGTLTQVVHGCGTQAFAGGVLLPTGNVVFVPFNASNVGMFDPVARTYSNLVSVSGLGTGKYSGGTLLPDGRVIMSQYNASNVGILNTRTPASVEFCRSPYFNKF